MANGPVTTAAQALHTLTYMVEELTTRRRPVVERLDRYYQGRECTLHYASEQFREFFARRYVRFSDNWAAVVADAPVERLAVTGIRPYGTEAETDVELWQDWLRTESDHLSDMAFLDAIVAKRAYALVWGDADGRPVITWEHPSQAIVEYSPETRARLNGVKLWCDPDGSYDYATLYTPDAVWKWQRRRGLPERSLLRSTTGFYIPMSGAAGGMWEPRQPAEDDTWPIPNPLGVVPLVEVQNKPRLLGEPLSDIDGTIAMQNAINLLWAYLFNAADYASFRQRIVLGADRPKVPVLNEQGQVIGERPVDLDRFAVDRVLWITDPNAKVAEWAESPLDNYTRVMETAVAHLAAQSRTPPHYLLLGKGLVNVSAEGMKVAETGLVKRTQEKTRSFGRAVREVFRLAALVRGEVAKAAAVAEGAVTWADVESRSEAQAVDAALKLRSMGYPLEWVSRRLGLSPTEIADVMAMLAREAAVDPLGVLARSAQDPGPVSAPVPEPVG